MNKRLISFFEYNQSLSSQKFDFTMHTSTGDVVQKLVNLIVTHLDDGFCFYRVFLDLAKAFDTVSVQITLRKLEVWKSIGVV